MTSSEKVNVLYEKYNLMVEGSFHNTLWQLIVNGVRKNIQSAFVFIPVPVTSVNVGIADLNVSGYTPSNFSIKSTVSKADREAMIDELNEVVFGITPDRAFEILLSSMKG